jgi:hypothetical protein
MRQRLMPILVTATALAAAAAAFTAAGSGSVAASPSAAGFVSLATTGIHNDYTPLVSPKDAVDKADLIVEGTLTDVVDGIVLRYPDPRYTARHAGAYATLVISVTKVIDGDPSLVSQGRIYLALAKSPVVTLPRLSAANPRSSVVAVLDDITAWTPGPGVTVERPRSIPAAAPLFTAYPEGLWLQGSTDTQVHGLGAHREDLAPAWGNPLHASDISAALQRAAGN